MSSSSVPEGPGAVSGAPNLPEGFAATFASRYVDTGGLRQHVVTGGEGPPLLLVQGREDIYFGFQFAKAANKLPDYVVRHYVDALAADPDALHGSFAAYRALDATIAQNQQRLQRRLTLPVLAIGGAAGIGEGAANTMKLAADDVRSVVIPGCGHYCLEEAPGEIAAALTAFLGPYRERPAPKSAPGPHDTVD
jgi:pimeloyl-ACP methyl ester carboxylesterase